MVLNTFFNLIGPKGQQLKKSMLFLQDELNSLRDADKKTGLCKDGQSVIDRFEGMLNNPDLKESFSKYRKDILEREWGHGSALVSAFRESYDKIPKEEIMPMVGIITANENFHTAIESCVGGERRQALMALTTMAGKVGAEDRVQLYSALQHKDFLPKLISGETESNVALFFSAMFDDVETEQAIAVIEHSPTFDHIEPTNDMAAHLVNNGAGRLVPLLKKAKDHNPANTLD